MTCSGGEGRKGYGGISEIKVITEIGGTKMIGVRGWYGSESREISHRWGGDRGFIFSRGLGDRQQRGTLVEVNPPFFSHKQNYFVLYL